MSWGSSFASDTFLFNGDALSDFSASIGNHTFFTNDLLSQDLGSSGPSYDVLLLESVPQGWSGAAIMFLGPDGAHLRAGLPVCAAGGFGACFIYPNGNAVDEQGFLGSVIEIQTSFNPTAVPIAEPPALPLIVGGILFVLVCRGFREEASGAVDEECRGTITAA